MKKNKQIFAKRILPVLLTLAMLLGAFPIMGISSSAATTYTKPQAGDLVGMDHTERVREEGDGSRYWLTLDDGVVHNIIDRQFKESTIEDMNYDPDLRTYCIEWGARVRSSETLKGVSTSDSSFWNSLSQTAKEGILLTLGFGYPANTPAELGVSSADDAIAATQVLLWEFELGYRTDYEKHTTESILFDGRASTHDEFGEDACGIDGTAAEPAYYAILAKAKAYKAKEGYSYTDLESSTKFLLWEGTDASQEDVHQVIACYLTPWKDLDEPWEENGSIEVFKKDSNGNNLSGAEFSVIDSSGNIYGKIGPTDSSGYAIIKEVPFGTYLIKETKAPDGYRLSSETWTVTLDENSPNGKATVEAVNTLQYVYGYATATKLLDGAAPGDARFTFTLKDSSGNVITTRENTSTGTFMFRDMNEFTYSMNDVGTHTYTITEEPKAGYSHDTHVLTVTHRVYMDNGTLKIEVTHSEGTTFSNTTAPPPSGSWKPSVTKMLNGATLQAGQFTFELVGGKSGTIYEAQTNKADGSVDFNGFNYTLDHVGTHTYIVRERKGSAGGYTYDEHEVVYTVIVSDAGDGSLKVEESHTGSTTFTNSYSSTGIWDPTASKTMEGRELKANEFWFELRDENGNLLQSVQNKANGDIDFASITYTQADVGVKKYTIRERKENKSGVTYCDLIVNVVVTIVDNNDGTLSVTPVYDNTPEFKNVYNASSSYTFEATKELVGGTLSEGQFTAVLTGNGKEYTAENDANGKFTFETLNFTLADVGTHTYTIREVKGNDANIVYDSTVYTVTLEISDNGDGSLKIVPSIANSALKFTNYVPTGEFTLEANKTLLGGTLSAGQFDFELLENGTVIDSTANAANGDISFKKLSYSLSDVGVKTYTIREVKGSDANIAYDGRTITVEVTISYSGSGDKLTVEYTYPDGNEFVNAIPTGTFAPVANKIFEDRSADGGRVLKDGEYQFVLSENGAELQKVWNKADGSIPFDAINYTLADVGTHTYTITEVVGNEYCVVYDTHTLTITVTVEYDGGESLTVTAVYEGGQTFTNVYEPVDITVNKIWDDNNNQDGDRTDIIIFLSSDDGHEPRTGIILKGESSYTWKDLPKYLNDGTPIKYTVTEASVNDYDVPVIKTEDGYNFVITNTQIPETVDVNITKYWRDNKDAQGVRHEEITVVLLGSDGSRREATFSGTGDRWWYTFYGLPRFHDEGKEIIYTVSEVEINGYVTEIIDRGNLNKEITNTIELGSLELSKDAEDGVLAGHRFNVKAETIFGTTVEFELVTDENGKAFADKLLPGTYTVTEIENEAFGGRYVLAEAQTVEVVGSAAEPVPAQVSFYNTLKRMSVTINKTAEDNVLEGHKFNLIGTDYLANAIDLIGTTDENGVLVFENLLAGEYTVTEIETDVRYVVPEAQTVNLTWGKDEAIDMHNALKRMSITINKTAEDDVLDGHKFKLIGTDYLANAIDLIGTTDENGELVFTDLLAGEYTITEVETAIRYVVPVDQDVTIDWGKDAKVDVHNDLKDWTLTVNKTDSVTDAPVAGAVYGIYLNGVLLDQYTTDENGTFTTKKYLCGEGYTMQEITPASGFTLDSTVYEIDGTSAIDCEAAVTELSMNVTNDLTEVTITKTDLTNGEPVPGAEITIKDAEGNVVYTAVTDENGEITAFYLPIGKYTFYESIAPDGYIRNTESFEFEILADGTVIGDTEITNKPTEIVINKSDLTTGEALPGATITITDEEGNIVFEDVTDENGEIKAMYLLIGKVYTFTETAAPDGYIRNTETFRFVINEDGSITGDTEITNKPTEVTITKTDLTDGKPLPGATITITDEEGNVVFEDVTDENGEIKAMHLLIGKKYTFKETYSPDGYKLNTNTFEFVIDADGTVVGDTEIKDEPITVILNKLDNRNEPVEGAVIELYDANMNVLGSFATDAAGTVLLIKLPVGKYFFKEISAPAKYELDDTLYSFTVNADGSVVGVTTFYNKLIVPQTGDLTIAHISFGLLALFGLAALSFSKKRRLTDAE